MTAISNANLAKIAQHQQLAERYAVGKKFRIDAPGYPKKVYTVTRRSAQGITADCGDGVMTWLDYGALVYYEKAKLIKIVGCCEHLTDAQYSEFENHLVECEERMRNDQIL